MKIRYFVLFCVALVLAGCGTTQPAIQPTSSATKMPRPTITIETALTVPQQTLPTQAPSLTPEPSQTNTSSSAEETQAPEAAFPTPCDNARSDQSSPNEKWHVLTCDYDNYIRKMIVENSTGIKWELNYQDFLDPKAKGSGIAVSADLYPLHWSPDGHYLYFTSYGGAEGGGTCFYGFGVQGLFRLDLQTGKVSTILAILPPDDWNGYEVAFSPTGRRFSYSRNDVAGKNSFHLVDVLTGQETTFPTEQQNGTFRWSPDGTSLAYSTSLCDFKAITVIHSFIKILTIADLSTRTIAQSDTDFLTIDDWSAEDNQLTIERESYLVNQMTTLSVDPNKNIVISSASPTP